MMWVWDYNEEDRQQRKVIYLLNSKDSYPIVTITADESASDIYMHCADMNAVKEAVQYLKEA